ncbi:MAG: (Acyl-carrier-protein) S-malonyltransferase, partial [Variovorax sp.]|nr:(Acyl-carrier-protein) S-malonyltransferase [Variovorax sp.]
AAWGQLAPLLPAPAAVAGYSVGELAAWAAAGVCDAATAMELARRRAALMDRDAAECPTGLLSISGLGGDRVDRLCADFDLAVAIRNGIDSVVVGGRQASLPAAEEAVRRLGGRGTLLNVQVASHTRWMARAARDFAELIAPLPFHAPRTALFSNAGGRVATVAHLKDALARQIDHVVRWDDCMEGIAARQVGCVLEVGPGQALARMWNQRHPHTPARSADEFRSARAVAAWVARWSG